jgi:tight adherence protein B
LVALSAFVALLAVSVRAAHAADKTNKERFDIVGEGHQTGGLRASVGNDAFPKRALLLTVPGKKGLPAIRFHVNEDGLPVVGLAVSRLGGGAVGHYVLRYASHRPWGEKEVETSIIVIGVGVIDVDYNVPHKRHQVVLPVRPKSPPPAHPHHHATGRHASVVFPNQPKSTSFWESGAGLIITAFAAALLLVLGLVLLLRTGKRRSSLRRRVAEFTPTPRETAAEAAGPARAIRLVSLEQILRQMSWWPRFKDNVENAGFTLAASDIVARAAGMTIIVAALIGLVVGSAAVSLLVIPFGLIAVRSLVRYKLAKRRQAFAEQLATHLEELASAMRAGHGLVSGLMAVARSASEPSRTEWTRVLTDEQLGMPLEEAMRALAGRMGSDDVEQVALVASLHHRTGGNMAEVLDRVSEGVRERGELRRELRALTSQARLSRWVVTVLPFALVLIIEIIDPKYMRPLFQTTGGFIVLAFAGVLVTIGSLIMRMFTEIKV